MSSSKFSLRDRLRSFRYAFRGLFLLIKKEHNARIHLTVAIAAIALGILLKITLTEWLFITILIGMVFTAELINTSIEKLSDITDLDKNEKIRDIKDYAAAAVFISALISAIIGAIIFVPRVIEIMKSF